MGCVDAREEELFSREALLLGWEGVQRLHQCRVAVFGVGGVGGYVAEALARAGVGAMDLIDRDRVSLSNLNRQVTATQETVGQLKTEAMAQRIHSIWPECQVTCHDLFYLPDTAEKIDLTAFDYVVDAVDTVTAKLELAQRCHRLNVPLISAMGAGNKLDPSCFVITDIYQTHTCPLARIMRKELKKRGVPCLKVCYSTEEALVPVDGAGQTSRVPGSVSFVPGVAGLMLAGEVVRELLKKE